MLDLALQVRAVQWTRTAQLETAGRGSGWLQVSTAVRIVPT